VAQWNYEGNYESNCATSTRDLDLADFDIRDLTGRSSACRFFAQYFWEFTEARPWLMAYAVPSDLLPHCLKLVSFTSPEVPLPLECVLHCLVVS
jgi:hypothetical protein